MIQDIYPKRLCNEFVPQAEPWKDDIIIFAKGNTLMVGGVPGELRFPVRQDITTNSLEYQYLFSLEGQGVYYALKENMEPLPGFSYLTLREIRYQMMGPQSQEAELERTLVGLGFRRGRGLFFFAAGRKPRAQGDHEGCDERQRNESSYFSHFSAFRYSD